MARVSPPTVTVFEQTCRDLNTPATQFVAEKQLTHFQESDTAIATAVSVIESSTESIARFHAARILRHAAVRHWSILPPPQRFGPDALRMLAVRAATNPTIGAAERTGLVVCAAVLFRRAFMEEGAESQLEFLASLREAAVGRSGNDPVAAATASEFFMTLADEFLSPGSWTGSSRR